MSTDMTPAELKKAKQGATELDSHDYRSSDDEDDYISATLYQAKDGRYFRYVSGSGMNSTYVGAGDFGEWLTEAESKTWNEF